MSNVTLNGEALVGWRHTPIDVQRACSMAAAAPERATRSLGSARSRSRAPPPARAPASASGQLLPEQLDMADEDRNDADVVEAPSALRYEDAVTTASSSFTPAFYSGANGSLQVEALLIYSLLCTSAITINRLLGLTGVMINTVYIVYSMCGV